MYQKSLDVTANCNKISINACGFAVEKFYNNEPSNSLPHVIHCLSS